LCLGLRGPRRGACRAACADAGLDQVADDLLDVAADIADLGELGGLDLDERGLGQLGQAAR
jgi:geranylgeranyl pyrophosphate synthase